MRITLQVLSSPESGTAGLHALRFAQTVGSSEHELGCVFFQDQGVLTGLAGCEPPQDELDLRRAWSELAANTQTPLLLCSASASRYGLLPDSEKPRVMSGFEIAGLGELAMAQEHADRLLTFADPL